MGSSHSSSVVNQKYNTTIVNRSDIDLLNKSINDFVANTVVNQASKCSASISQLQTIDLSGMIIGGDLNIGEVDQSQTSAITFDCIQISEFKNDIANGILNKYLDAMKESYSSDVLDKLNASAQSSGKGGFASTGSVSASSKVNVDYKFTNITDTHKNLQNIVQNSITNNMNLNDIQECIATVKTNQQFSLAGSKVGGSVTIGAIRQDQAASLMAKCTQQKNNANKITNQILADAGIQIDETNSTKKSTTIADTTSSTAVNSGFFESLGDGIKSALQGVGDMVGAIFGGLLTGPALSIFVCCIVCLCILALLFGVSKLFSSGDGPGLSGLTEAISSAVPEVPEVPVEVPEVPVELTTGVNVDPEEVAKNIEQVAGFFLH